MYGLTIARIRELPGNSPGNPEFIGLIDSISDKLLRCNLQVPATTVILDVLQCAMLTYK